MASVNKAELEALYIDQRKSIPDIATKFCIGYSAARTLLLNAGIKLRSRADGVRAASSKLGKHLIGKQRMFSEQWRKNISESKRKRADLTAAGVSKKASGYVEITRGQNKWRGLHVVVMECHIGRRISHNEVVHHIDEDKSNNAIENLMLMTRSEHTSLHRKQKKGIENGIR